jgi:hypothetical protein
VLVAYTGQATDQPHRRADDRDGLDKPHLDVLGNVKSFIEELAMTSPLPVVDTPLASQPAADPVGEPDLPDMSDTPDFDDVVLPDAMQA